MRFNNSLSRRIEVCFWALGCNVPEVFTSIAAHSCILEITFEYQIIPRRLKHFHVLPTQTVAAQNFQERRARNLYQCCEFFASRSCCTSVSCEERKFTETCQFLHLLYDCYLSFLVTQQVFSYVIQPMPLLLELLIPRVSRSPTQYHIFPIS